MADLLKKFFKGLELDSRMLGMIGALLLLWISFNFFTDGRFLTPRNLFNLSVQTASVAVMATGMVFVIVTRHIDLSVGSLLGFLGMLMGALQVHILPQYLGFGHPTIWIITVIFGIGIGVLIGAAQGWVIGFLAVPSFIVTLGGFLIYRGAAWWVTTGQTVAPLDVTYKLLGGGAEGTLGADISWLAGAAASIIAVVLMIQSRRQKQSHGFSLKPIWAEYTLGAIAVAMIMGFVTVMNSYPLSKGAVKRIFDARSEEIPQFAVVHGVAIPVLIVVIVAIVMTLVAKKTRFGRYIFATGGNPEAAELSGVDTKMLTVKVFALMGGLTAIAAVIASARLGSVGNDLGTLDELRVIAAAVIGGTALSGGFGTIYGALLGALIMQSLQSGMAMVGVDAPLQSIVVGLVLVLAVYLDIAYRRRAGK
ncbi:sugar ABC transporter permease [Maritalea sp.]|jgi:D-xylose transport system permease protein|uniref:sugar ABC transporter permease n=1 Tax=Maritalea sp. TaxID=2003361 RepID=UPI0039E66657